MSSTITTNHHHRGQRGLTLIELMVAIGLGLVVITLVLRSYATVSLNAGVNSAVSEYQTNGRYALEALKREVRHAALRPMVWDKDKQLYFTPAALAKNYGCGPGTATNLFAGLEASNDSNPFATSCLQAASDRKYARGDVLMVRRTDLEPAVARVAGATYLRVAYGKGQVFLGTEAPPEYPQPAFDYRLVNEVFFINEFTRSADEQPKVPALYRLTLTLGANPVFTPLLVASNVEHFQVQFGKLTVSSGDMQYVNANSLSGADWESVTTARIWLLIRASAPEVGMVSESYTLGDVTYTPQDHYRRTVLTGTINLRNM
jgi:type IV pilus assembly protein PilW